MASTEPTPPGARTSAGPTPAGEGRRAGAGPAGTTTAPRHRTGDGTISIRGLSKVYHSRRGESVLALQGVTTEIADGDFVTLVGPSGCGKSTLLNVLAGLTPASDGIVEIGGTPVHEHAVRPGLVFQSPVLLPWRTAVENVHLPAEAGKEPAARGGAGFRDRATELLQMVGLGDFTEKYPWELSGGMQARVAIARALLLESPIMCLDEPFAALDEFTREQMLLELLDLWHAQRFTTVFVTHNIFEATFLSDRVLVMTPRPGKVVAEIAIDLPRPRTRDMFGSDEFTHNVRRVREAMKEYWEESP